MPSLLTSKKLNIKTAFKHLNCHMILKIIQQIIQMFDKIQMILMMKMSISNNRITRLNKDTKYYIENVCHQFPDLYMSSNSRWIYSTEAATSHVLYVCNFIKERFQHRFFLWTLQIFKNSCFEKHVRTPASDSSYILHKILSKIIQEPDWPSFHFET